MKFVIAALAALANAKPHEFFAESNYICEMCQKAVEFANAGDNDSLDKLY